MRSGMRVSMLNAVKGSRVFCRSDFHFDEYDHLHCRLVPGSSFDVGSRQDGGVIHETPGFAIAGMSTGGSHERSKAGYKAGLTPGLVNSSEEHHVNDGKQVISLFKKWLVVLEEEFTAEPVMRRVRELDSAIEVLREGIEEIDQDVDFTSQEIEEIRVGLARLQEQLAEHVDAAEEAQEQIQQARKDIEWLQKMVGQVKKRTWREAFAARLGPILATASSEGTKLVIKELVTVGVKLIGGPS